MASATGDNAKLTQALATKIQNGIVSKKEFGTVLESFQKEISLALPVHLKANAEKYARQCLSLFSSNPKLQKCRPVTILSALMTASSLGLDLTPQLGQCYIIPYNNRKKVGNEWVTVPEAQFQIGYRGAIALIQRSGNVARIAADVVYEKDMFVYSKGLHPKLEHEESLEEDRGEPKFVYAVANLTNGGYAFEVWPVAKVIAHAKKFSKSFWKTDYKTKEKTEDPNSPWKTDFEAMAKKTLIMAIWKYLPVSTEVMMAMAQDETTKDDLTGVQDEKDIIDVLPMRDEEQEPAEGTEQALPISDENGKVA